MDESQLRLNAISATTAPSVSRVLFEGKILEGILDKLSQDKRNSLALRYASDA